MKQNSLITKKRVAIVTNNLHCERNMQYFSTLEYYFKANGWEIAEDFDVNLVIFCACGFHDTMYEKLLKTRDKLKKMHFLEKNIVVMGCLPKTHEEDLLKEFQGQIIYLHHEELLDDLINAKIPFTRIKPISLFKTHKKCRHIKKEYDYFYIKIAEGCLRGCTYCVINKAKGELKSVPLEKIVSEFKSAIQGGHNKIFLMGEDTFAYGFDINTTIIQLVEHLLAIEPKVELYFGYLHNRWLIKYSRSILSLCKRGVIRELHIGLQHVNEMILTRMGRHVDFSRLYDLIKTIKKENPGFYLTADIMVGFPGETREIFRELADFFKQDKCFDKICHFSYSDVKGAPSCQFADKVPAAEAALRWEEMDKILGPRSISYQNKEPETIDEATFRLATLNDYLFCSDTFREKVKEIEDSQDLAWAKTDILAKDEKDFGF
ncbi:MAG: radical SAM protein [Candidatus Aminicenantes bacterium]|nr:MAG: radical SAM protein [Candidatus Aminicenantes bacterium]